MGPVVVWNSTRTCNLRCRHCYMCSDGQKYDGELTTEEAKRFIDGLAEFRVPVLLFSGGEPLIRPDFFELAEYARDRGVRPTLSTNGTLIYTCGGAADQGSRRRLRRHLARRARRCERYVPRRPGAYQRAMEGIENCVAVGQRVGLRFTINHHNIMELDKIF